MATGSRPWLAAALLAALALLACRATEPEEATPGTGAAQDVVYTIPWEVPEEAIYRILDGEEVKGRGILRIEGDGPRLRLAQEFEGQGFTDTVVATVDGQALKPQEVTRVIAGPEGERRWEVSYSGDRAVVQQRAGLDQRTDRLAVPEHSYDKWSEIFLWRTIDFRQGYTAAYNTIISADLAKPDRSLVVLEVTGQELVEVAAGSFEAWRLEIRPGGREQTAWIAVDSRQLVRYDNGFLVFELEELR